jgi:glutathione S-transferase
MDKGLTDQPWISGDSVGLADFIAAPLIDRLDDLGFAQRGEDAAPRMTDWFARLRARPSFATAFYPKARLSEFLPIGPLRREVAPD